MTWPSALTIGAVAAGGGFLPSDVPGLLGAWHMDDALTDSTNAIRAYAKFGTTVDAVESAARPEYIASWRNGHAAIRSYPGVPNSLLGASLPAAVTQPCTYYLVGSSCNASPVYILGCSNNRLFARESNFGTLGRPGVSNGGSSYYATAAPGANTPIVARWIMNGASSSVRVEPHGGAVITGTGNIGADNGSTGFLLGGFGSTMGDAQIAMALLYSGVAGVDFDDTKLLQYLRDWGDVVHA